MSRLSPEARAIVNAARGGDEPSLDDRKRLRASLVLRLGAGFAAATATTSAGSGAAAAGATKAGLGVLMSSGIAKGIAVLSAVAAIGVGAHYTLSPPPPSAPAVVTATPLLPPSTASAPKVYANQPALAPGVEEPAEQDGDPKPAAPVAAPIASGPRLEEEVRALREAHTALRDGHPDKAMDVLERDAAPEQEPALAQERSAMRVFTLCRMGRAAEARSEAERFLAKWPKSPLAPRVRASCTVAEP